VPIARAQAAYVTNNGSDSISVLDRNGDTVVSVAVDVDPSAHEAPHHLAVDAASGRLFVALAFPPEETPAAKDKHGSHGAADGVGMLARLDLATLSVQDTRDVAQNPGDVVLTHDRTRVLVTHFDMRRAMKQAAAGSSPSALFASLQVWDATTMEKRAERPLCVAPHGVVTTADDAWAIVACYGSDELCVVDLTQPTLPTSRYPLGNAPGLLGAPSYGPYSAVLSPDEAIGAVSDLEGRDVRFFDWKARRFVTEHTLPVGGRAMMPDWAGHHSLIQPMQGPDRLWKIDADSGVLVGESLLDPAVCEAPHVVKRAKDGRVYVVCEGNHKDPGTVIEIDPDLLYVKGRWVVGVYPDGIAFGE
jgi:hypothetical protein